MFQKFKEKWNRFIAARRNRVPIGLRGERAAAKFLRRKKYKILGCSVNLPGGEIDIIAVDQRTVVFVEVKTRSSEEKGHPADAVDEVKQQKITRLAQAYSAQHNLQQYSKRFDIVACTWPDNQQEPVIEHYVAAFEALTGQFD